MRRKRIKKMKIWGGGSVTRRGRRSKKKEQ